jgi:2-dehydro-3-deoxy-L-rhamnonate dehydrogenase (NAD+)
MEYAMTFFDLTGQTALVTGAAQGIGEAVARRLASAGASVALCDIQAEGAAQVSRSIRESGGQSLPVPFDITKVHSVQEGVAQVLAWKDRIDILVNNAGIAGRTAPLWEQTEEDWMRAIAVNLTSVFHCCRAVIQHMRERR